MRLLDFFFPPKPTNPELWHKSETAMIVHTIRGEWITGSVWRRFREGQWEYDHREETDEEWVDSRTY